jgi:hypothetical protein
MLMQNKRFLVGYKTFFGLLGLSSVALEITVGIQRGIFNPGNFFSYFTVESNIFAAIIFLCGAAVLWRGGREGKTLALFRGAATLYMVTTGIVFGVLLSGYDPSTLTLVKWDNTVLHYIIPVAVLVDWLIDPPVNKIVFKKALVWLAFPLVYLVYTLIRGPIAGWYPYPFLNPDQQHGYAGIMVTALGITATVALIAFMLTKISGTKSKKRKTT